MTDHKIKYEKSLRHGWLWRARCSCGWAGAGERDEIVEAAQAHEQGREWAPADPFAAEQVAP